MSPLWELNSKIKRKKRNGCESAKSVGRPLHTIVEGGGEGAQVKILYYESFVGEEEVLLLENAYCREL